MRQLLFTLGLILFIGNIVSCSDLRINEERIPVIFDTDLGNDIDDVMALQMLFNYVDKGEIDLIGISISKSNPYSIKYIDGYNRFNNMGNIPLGYVYDGPNKDDGNYLLQTLDTVIDGKKVLYPELSIYDSLPKAHLLHRKLLSEQADSSVVFIVVGPNTNIRRLLESSSDQYSTLNGVELVRQKVNTLVVMGGNFDIYECAFPEWNIVQDIHSSQIMFNKWPSKIVVSGFEIGQKLLFPHQNILNDIFESYRHPLSVSYKLFDKMPYDRPTWDLTSVLYAINQDANFFDISEPGIISIDDKGNSKFIPSKNGKHYYLSIKDEQIPVTLDALISSVTKIN